MGQVFEMAAEQKALREETARQMSVSFHDYLQDASAEANLPKLHKLLEPELHDKGTAIIYFSIFCILS